MPLPVAVVIPHVTSRREFFTTRCIPSILEQDPTEVVVMLNDGSSGRCGSFRNAGFMRTRSPYVLPMDDDTVLLPGAIKEMVQALESSGPTVAYAYSNYRHVVNPGVSWPGGGTGTVTSRAWDQEALYRSNFISGVALLRARLFEEFWYDEELTRLVDWDLWIRMAKRGLRGVWVDKTLFEAHQIDRGLTLRTPDDIAIAAVRRKNAVWR